MYGTYARVWVFVYVYVYACVHVCVCVRVWVQCVCVYVWCACAYACKVKSGSIRMIAIGSPPPLGGLGSIAHMTPQISLRCENSPPAPLKEKGVR